MKKFVTLVTLSIITLTSSIIDLHASEHYFKDDKGISYGVPKHVFLMAIDYLDPKSFSSALQVNKSWKNTIDNSPQLWLADQIEKQDLPTAVLLRQAARRNGGMCQLMSSFSTFPSDLRSVYPFFLSEGTYEPSNTESLAIFRHDKQAWNERVRHELIALQEHLNDTQREQLFNQLVGNPAKQLSLEQEALLVTDICHSKLLMLREPQIAMELLNELPELFNPNSENESLLRAALLCFYGRSLLETPDDRSEFLWTVSEAARSKPEEAIVYAPVVSRKAQQLIEDEDFEMLMNSLYAIGNFFSYKDQHEAQGQVYKKMSPLTQRFVDQLKKRATNSKTNLHEKLDIFTYLVTAGYAEKTALYKLAIEAATSDVFTYASVTLLRECSYKDIATKGLIQLLRQFVQRRRAGQTTFFANQKDLGLLLEGRGLESIGIGGEYLNTIYQIEDEANEVLTQQKIRLYRIKSSKVFKVLQKLNPERAKRLLNNFVTVYRNREEEKSFKRLIWAAENAVKVFHDLPLAREIANEVYESKEELSAKDLAYFSFVYALTGDDTGRTQECLKEAISQLKEENLNSLSMICATCRLIDDEDSLQESITRAQELLLAGYTNVQSSNEEILVGNTELTPSYLYLIENFRQVFLCSMYSSNPEILAPMFQLSFPDILASQQSQLFYTLILAAQLDMVGLKERAENLFAWYFEHIRLPGSNAVRQEIALSTIKITPDLLYTLKLPGYILLLRKTIESSTIKAKDLMTEIRDAGYESDESEADH